MLRISWICALLLACCASPAWAAGAYDVGLGVGYALPVGDAMKSSPLSDQAAGALGVHLDAVYRYTHRIRFGVTGSYGPVSAGSAIASAHAVAQWRMVLGALGEYHWAPFSGSDPWVSLSAYWSQFDQQVTSEDLGKFVKSETVWQSPIGAEVRAGYQISFLPDLYVGPYVSAAVESFGSAKTTSTVANATTTSDTSPGSGQQTWHAWFGLGITGRYGL